MLLTYLNDFGKEYIEFGMSMNSFDELYRYAVDFATTKHENMTYGKYPYVKHLRDVENVLVEFGLKESYLMRICAWLHDVVEDTDATLNDIENIFGKMIKEIVDAVTDPEGKNRKERKIKLYEKIQKSPFILHAIALKLGDRIANVRQGLFEYSKVGRSSLFEMYQKEQIEFQKNLKNPIDLKFIYGNPHRAMWDHLNFLFDTGGGNGKQEAYQI